MTPRTSIRRAMNVPARWLVLMTVTAGGASCLLQEPDPPATTATTAGTTGPGNDSSDDTSTSSDSSSGSDTSTSGAGTAGNTPDGVACEEELCIAPEICCAAMAGSSCKETCDSGESPMVCDGPEDCGAQSCCFGLTAGTICSDTCEGINPDLVCKTDADCSDAGGTCSPHPFIYWLSVCG